MDEITSCEDQNGCSATLFIEKLLLVPLRDLSLVAGTQPRLGASPTVLIHIAGALSDLGKA